MRLRSVAEDAPARYVAPAERAAAERQRHARLLEEGDRRVDPLVVAAFTADDPLAEAARSLRGHIVAARTAEDRAVRTVGFAGIDAHGEIAAVAANTAVAFAQAGYRTLLVDAVLDAPSLHHLFHVPERAGLTTLLAAPDAADRDAFQGTAVAALTLLPAGPPAPNPASLFDRARLFERLRGTMDRHDYALVLAPADPALAAAACERLDGVVILARRDASDARRLDALVDALAARGTPVLGLVHSD